ncbi:MAG TPA: hypothetical protein VHW26_13310 [Solirubrobacteraceae bacterium]|jgi:hypothetical protein|nr:hypothetical protein [Solirubrobacteraceae bacterium]
MEVTRGSDKVGQLGRAEISQEDLDHLAGLGEVDGVDLVSWHKRGTPAIERVSGSLHVAPSEAGRLVDQIVAGGVVGGLHVFPRGIPAVTLVEMQFDTDA